MPRPCTIYLDVTTLVESRGPANGILRVLRETAELLTAGTANVVPCVFDNRARGFRSLLNWQALMTARDQLAGSNRPPVVGHPSAVLPPVRIPKDTWLRGLVFSLPVDVRDSLFVGRRAVQTSVSEVSRVLKLMVRPGSSIPLERGTRIAYGKGDILLQPGSQWNAVGIVPELERAKAAGTQVVSVVYDAIPILNPEFVGANATATFTAWFRAVLATSHSILAISHMVKADIEALARDWGVTCPPVSVLRLGDNSLPSPPAEVTPALAALVADPFVLCLGTIEIRKNHRLLAQVWRRLAGRAGTPRLIIVGKPGWLVLETTSVLERDLALKPYLTLVTGASDTDLAWLVSKALFTVFPSFAEGWGLPVGECLAAGKIVIASDVAAVVEAGQGLALHLPPDDVPAWADLIAELARDPDRRRQLESDIDRRFRVYPWSQTARDLATHVEHVLEGDGDGERVERSAPAVTSVAG